MSKHYVGERDENGVASVFVEEDVDGRVSRRKLRQIKRHSPAGFEWGYGGSGPADLANSILAEQLGVAQGVSPRLYQQFKFNVVAGLEREGFRLSSETVNQWLKARWQAGDEDGIRADLSVG